jgi:hypothetical protein
MTLHLTGPALRFSETSRSLQPARQVNAVVRQRGGVGVRRFDVRRIPIPPWARTPDVWLDLKLSDYHAMQAHRERMLEVVHRMIEDHLNRSGYVAESGDEAAPGLEAFPSAGRLSGEYYLGDESYKMEFGPVRHFHNGPLPVGYAPTGGSEPGLLGARSMARVPTVRMGVQTRVASQRVRDLKDIGRTTRCS